MSRDQAVWMCIMALGSYVVLAVSLLVLDCIREQLKRIADALEREK